MFFLGLLAIPIGGVKYVIQMGSEGVWANHTDRIDILSREPSQHKPESNQDRPTPPHPTMARKSNGFHWFVIYFFVFHGIYQDPCGIGHNSINDC